MITADVWTLNPPAPDDVIRALEARWPDRLPREYLALLQVSDGASSTIVQLWSAAEVLADRYAAHEFGPHLVFFGSDGGGELFAFDAREPVGHVTMAHSISDWLEDTLVVAKSIDGFIRRAERLATDEGYSLFNASDE
jgi:hypothetical protein